jgi:hypothetical protein
MDLDTVENAKKRATGGTWLACALAALISLGLSLRFLRIIRCEKHIYALMEMKELPSATERTLELGPHMWIVILLATAWGFRLLRMRRGSDALSWFMWMMLLVVVLQGLMTYALFYPIVHIQIGLPQ